MTALGEFLAGLHKPGMKWTGPVSSTNPFTVRSGPVDIPCVQVGSWTPVVGAEVLVENVGGRALALGQVWPWARPDVVTVTDEEAFGPDANGNSVLLLGHLTAKDDAGREYALRYLPSYTPTVNDVVQVSWQSSVGVVYGVLSAAIGAPPDLPVQRQTSSGKATARALAAGSWRGGKWRTDSAAVTQGDYRSQYGQNSGAFFYGNQLVVPGGVATSARIRLNRVRGGANYGPGEPVHLYHHSSAYRPASDVSRGIGPRNVTVPLGAAWYPLDLGIAQALLAGGGVGITGEPYVNLADLKTDPQSGLVEIDWVTT